MKGIPVILWVLTHKREHYDRNVIRSIYVH